MGRASAIKASRADIRDAFGGDVVQLINSHADSISDLLRRLHHEIHMRVEHGKLLQEQLDATRAMMRDMDTRLTMLEAPRAEKA